MTNDKEGYTPELKFRCGQQRDIKDPDCSKCSSGILLSDADRCYICGKKFERGITVHRDSQGWRHPDTDPRCHTPTRQPEAQQRIEQAVILLEQAKRSLTPDLFIDEALALLQAGDQHE